MKKGLIAILLIILSSAVVFLFIQNRQIQKRIDEMVSEKNVAPASSTLPDTKPANPPGASPFDKPNVDPLANGFPNGKAPITSIKFDHIDYNFGRVTEGQKVQTKFRFTNTGTYALIITHAQASCGCTVPTWPQDPIKPGESGEITVRFDSYGKNGETTKVVTVDANTNPQFTTLTIKALVVPRDN